MTRLFLAVLTICLVLLHCLAFAEDSLVAIVNNDVITQKDIDDFVSFMRIQMSSQHSEEEIKQKIDAMLPDLIKRLIEDRLILQAAYKEGIVINENRIKARVNQMRERYLSELDFKEALISQGLSQADIELKLKEQFLMVEIIDRKIKSKIVIKPQEVTDYYYANIHDFNKPEQRQVRCLILQDTALVNQIKNKLFESQDLDEIAGSHSLEVTDLGWVNSKQLKKELADVVFNLEMNRPSSIIESEGRFYVLEVVAVESVGERSLSEVQEAISSFLFERKMQVALIEWLEQLKQEAYIRIKNEYSDD